MRWPPLASNVARGNVASSSNAHAALLWTPVLDYDDDDDGHNDDDDDDDEDDGHNEDDDDDDDDGADVRQKNKSTNLLFCQQAFLSFRHWQLELYWAPWFCF